MGLFEIMGAAKSSGLQASLDAASYTVFGDSTVEHRVAMWGKGVTIGRHDPAAVQRIRSVVKACGARDDLCVLRVSLADLRSVLVYQLDDETLDKYAPYSEALSLVKVDCSSMAVAIATVGAVQGMPVGASTIAQVNPKTGEVEWSHIYGLAWPRLAGGVRRRTAVDVSERAVPVGWEPQRWRVRAKRDWLYDVAAWDRWYAAGANPDRLPSATWRDVA